MENTRLAPLLDGKIVIGSLSESLACPARRNSSLAQPIRHPVLDHDNALSTGCRDQAEQGRKYQTHARIYSSPKAKLEHDTLQGGASQMLCWDQHG